MAFAELCVSLPMDVGILYSHAYFDDDSALVVGDMIEEIWTAYLNRFDANTWMSESTKKAAREKIENMVAVIAYPDNLEPATILSVAEGGTAFNNKINILRAGFKTIVRTLNDKQYYKTRMLMSPDTVNACYIPQYNTMNIPVGILHWPMYSPDMTYAQNLGAIGAVIGHEIGHAFDAFGSTYDKNGVKRDWWTKEDKAVYEEIKQTFLDYYAKYEVVQDVVQDPTITITENMADFAGLQCVMDILADDVSSQKEALISFAQVWAKLGTEKNLTHPTRLADVHSSNNVRVDATVSSLDVFYEIYDISEDDPMYVAPENRLKLW